jgi:hypothetical protein
MSGFVIWEVATYKLFQYATGFRYQNRPVKAMLVLEEAGGKREVYAYFTTETPIPNEIIAENRMIVWYEYDQFHPIMELLREEGPVYVHILDRTDRKLLAIATDKEPVGEGEG